MQDDAVRDFEPGELDALCKVGLDQLNRGESIDAETVFREIEELQRIAGEQAKQTAPPPHSYKSDSAPA